MKQFDVFANPFPRSRQRQPFLVNLQSDLLGRHVDTVVVAPLEPAGQLGAAERLNPTISFDGADYALIVQEIVAIRGSRLGDSVGSVAEHRYAIIGAIDFLFTGV